MCALAQWIARRLSAICHSATTSCSLLIVTHLVIDIAGELSTRQGFRLDDCTEAVIVVEIERWVIDGSASVDLEVPVAGVKDTAARQLRRHSDAARPDHWTISRIGRRLITPCVECSSVSN